MEEQNTGNGHMKEVIVNFFLFLTIFYFLWWLHKNVINSKNVKP